MKIYAIGAYWCYPVVYLNRTIEQQIGNRNGPLNESPVETQLQMPLAGLYRLRFIFLDPPY